MKKNVCGLKMLDLYFSEYSFSLTRGEENSDYSSNINISYSSAKDNDLKYKVVINLMLENENKTLILNVQAVGIFEVDKANVPDDIVNQIIKQNTVAIMFPYIRSQVSLLTTQPGMTPIVLPPINIVALVEQSQLHQDNKDK